MLEDDTGTCLQADNHNIIETTPEKKKDALDRDMKMVGLERKMAGCQNAMAKNHR